MALLRRHGIGDRHDDRECPLGRSNLDTGDRITRLFREHFGAPDKCPTRRHACHCGSGGVARIDVVAGVIDPRHFKPRDRHVDVLLTDEADRIAVIFEDQANGLVRRQFHSTIGGHLQAPLRR